MIPVTEEQWRKRYLTPLNGSNGESAHSGEREH